MSMKGIDVSKFQGIIDWEQVKSSGVQFAMIRAGYGFGAADEHFQRNASECNRLRIPMGVYWFCYALTPEQAVQEADYCAQTIQNYSLEYPVAYDVEQATLDYASSNGVSMTRELVTSIVNAFCSRMEEHGYFAMYYSNRNFLHNYLDDSLKSKYALWYARYTGQYDGTACGIWQYSNRGSIPGISGAVDLDIGYEDYPSIIRAAGLNHLDGQTHVSSASDSASAALNYITYVIQPGETFSGIALKYGSSYQTLAALNKISNPELIFAGQTIRVPENSSFSAQYHTIHPGETLSEIARQYGTTVSALQALNGISDPNLIYAGNSLRVR